MEQIQRITYMEQILDEAEEKLAALSAALEGFEQIQPRLSELSGYYSGGQWLRDFEADAAGRLPETLKRGVLSEDAVYNLLEEAARLQRRMAKLSAPDKDLE